MARNIIFVALGGALGSILRYLASRWINDLFPSSFPFGTMSVNVLGCLLIGIFYGLSERFGLGGDIKLLLTVGLCGGFTTFSTFMNENLTLFRSNDFIYTALYAGGSLALGLIAVYIGKAIINIQ